MTIAQCKAARRRAKHDPRYKHKGTSWEEKAAAKARRRERDRIAAIKAGRSFGFTKKK